MLRKLLWSGSVRRHRRRGDDRPHAAPHPRSGGSPRAKSRRRRHERVDTLADKAQAASAAARPAQGGLKGKLADELADDAVFLRKLKPSLMKKRMRGEAPTTEMPVGAPAAARRGRSSGSTGEGTARNPFVVVGAALVAGVALAKWIDWRGHGPSRR